MTFPGLTRSVLCGTLCLAVAFGLTGCLSYRCGSLMHPQVRTVAIGEFSNRTDTAQLSTWLRQALSEQFMVDGSLRVTTCDKADVILTGRITDAAMLRVADLKTRADEARDDDRDAYQSSIFRVEVAVEFDTLLRNRDRCLLPRQQIRGRADFPRLADLETARQDGLKRAAGDAAVRIVTSITEGW